MADIKISPSLMCADFINLGDHLDIFAATGVEYLHIDIMDGHYVPNFTLGPTFCKAVASYTNIPLDVHLMIEHVDDFLEPFVKDGNVGTIPGSVICFHPEAVYHPQRTLDRLKDLGVRRGIAIDPSTPMHAVAPLLSDIDMLCVMTVNPGYSGQPLVPQTLLKVAQAADMRRELGLVFEIEVDGNVSWENIPQMLRAGAEVLVAGTSSIFDGKSSVGDAITKLRSLVDSTVTC